MGELRADIRLFRLIQRRPSSVSSRKSKIVGLVGRRELVGDGIARGTGHVDRVQGAQPFVLQPFENIRRHEANL